MLYAALSCLQGRPTVDAIRELCTLDIDGIQLTAGCAPAAVDDIEAALDSYNVRTHHGWTPHALRARVWDGAELHNTADSVHAPRAGVHDAFWQHIDDGSYGTQVFEVMYPGYCLGSGTELRRAVDAGVRLAVDVSHLHLQLHHGAANHDDIDAVLNYDNIAEIHVSRDTNGRDAHAPLDGTCYQLDWVRERHTNGTPTIVECYLHHLDTQTRQAQFDVITETLTT